MASYKGHLLIASSQLHDPNFIQSVVLIVQHDEQGTLGVALNRPLETTIKQACEEFLDLPCTVQSPLHQGGPCEGPLMVLHSTYVEETEPAEKPEDSFDGDVVPGVRFTTDRDEIHRLLQGEAEQVKFFVGYSGWGPGQLEAEIEAGAWLTALATREQVFFDRDEQWSKLITRLTLGRWIDPDAMPHDPSMN